MAEIKLTFNDEKVLAALNELALRVDDLTPAMHEIADVLADATDRAFMTESDPAGEKWDPLSAVTLALRPEREGGQILSDSGLLAASIVTDAGRNHAEIGTNRVYAPTHQFGARQGEYGRTRRGVPIPWGDIPARPFLGIGPDDEADILDIATRHLAAAFDGG